MRSAKLRGEIERFPGGRRARGLPPLSKNKHVRKAQRIIEARMARAVVVPAVDTTKAERLSEATDRSLGRVQEILDEEFDPREEFKQYQLQMNVALAVIASQVRLDAAALQAASGGLGGLDDDDLDSRIERKMRVLMAYEAEVLAEAEAGEGREGEAVADDVIGDVSDVGAEVDADAGSAARPAEAAE
jgi:hypothetical protein